MSRLDTLPSVVNRVFQPDVPVEDVPVKAVNDKSILVLCSKTLSQEDMDVFEEYGSVVVWNDKYVNVPLSQIPPFDYLVGDMSSKNFRLTLGRTDLSAYKIVSYVSVLQKVEDFIEQVPCNNVLTSIPHHAINKADFDNQLQNAKLISPSVVKSFFKWVLGCLKK